MSADASPSACQQQKQSPSQKKGQRFYSPPDEHRAEPAAEAKPKPEARPKAQLIISVKTEQETEDILQRQRNPPGKQPKRARTTPGPESQPAPAPEEANEVAADEFRSEEFFAQAMTTGIPSVWHLFAHLTQPI